MNFELPKLSSIEIYKLTRYVYRRIPRKIRVYPRKRNV